MGRLATSLVFLTLLAAFAHADNVPNCIDAKGKILPVNNAQVIGWKATSKNQYHDRGHIKGELVKAYSDATHHHHWKVQIGDTATETIEVVYNEEFGGVPQVEPGSSIEACGDYITSNKKSGPYPASPDGAIVHWVHMSTNSNHPSGFMVVDGTLCGQDK